MYTTKNFKTKKALKTAVAAGERVTLQSNFIGPTPTDSPNVSVEGPHGVHTWYAEVVLQNGVIVKVK